MCSLRSVVLIAFPSLLAPQHTAIRSGLVEAKIDSLARVVNITRATKAAFSMQQWQDLRDRLQEWQHNIGEVKGVLADVSVKLAAQPVSAGNRGSRGNRETGHNRYTTVHSAPLLAATAYRNSP